MPQEIDFSQIDYKRANEIITESIPPDAEENLLYYTGDHWQDGDGWIGPKLDSTHTLFESTWAKTEEMFTFQNAIREVVNREVQAASGDMPSWKLVLKRTVDEENPMTPEEKELVSEAEGMFTRWIAEHNVVQTFREALSNSALTGESVVRFFIPPSKLSEGDTLPRVEPQQVKDALFIETGSPIAATIFTDRLTMRKLGLIKYQTTDVMTGDQFNWIEKTWIDPETLETFIQILPEEDSGDTKEAMTQVFLNGNMTMQHIKRDSMITPAVRSLQKSLNMCLTMMSRNIVSAGFLERLIMNAQLPGTFVEDDNGDEVFVPSPMATGAGSTTFLAGHVVTDAEGNEKLATPQAFYSQPSPSETFMQARDTLYAAILQEVSQSHVLITAMARVSGESRRQARSEFATAAATSAIQLLELIRWSSDVFFAFADLLTGGTRYSENLTISSEVILDVGVPIPDEIEEMITMYNSGIISADTVRQRFGIANAGLEDEKIASQVYQSADLSKIRAEIFLLLTRSGVAPLQAAIAAGYSQEFSNVIAANYTEEVNAAPEDGQAVSVDPVSGRTRESALNNDEATAGTNPLKDTSAFKP